MVSCKILRAKIGTAKTKKARGKALGAFSKNHCAKKGKKGSKRTRAPLKKTSKTIRRPVRKTTAIRKSKKIISTRRTRITKLARKA